MQDERLVILRSGVSRLRLELQILGACLGVAVFVTLVVLAAQEAEPFKRTVVVVIAGLLASACAYAVWKCALRLKHGYSITVYSDGVEIMDGKQHVPIHVAHIRTISAELQSRFVVYRIELKNGKSINLPEVANRREVIEAIKSIMHPSSRPSE